MQTAESRGPMLTRMIGVMRLDANTFEEIEHDKGATSQAVLIVIMAAIAGGIGSLGQDRSQGLIAGVVSSLVGWVLLSGFIYLVGTKLLAGPGTISSWREVMRTFGFAYTPLLLTVVGVIPILGAIISLFAILWFLVAVVLALRQALDTTTSRAMAIGIVAWFLLVAASVVASIILGSAIYGVASLF